jgi:outer membrane protein OmpA-like peptidoglycan-associated protein
MSTPRMTVLMFGAAALTILGSGCASKGYVNRTLDPVNEHVSKVEQATNENRSTIEGVQKDVARVEERAVAADGKAEDASRQAQEAGRRAEDAGKRADGARQVADGSVTRVDGLNQKIENLDNYRLVATKAVTFGFNRFELSDEAKAALDEATAGLQDRKNYVIEIRGFTDTTGDPHYNLSLSQKRADAVVRYLTVEHKIPLYRVHVLGVGEVEPVADNKTREGREQNRRVELRLFSASVDGDNLQARTQE